MSLNSITASAHFYGIIFAAIAFLAAFNILEVTVLLVHKRRLEKAEKRKELLKHRAATALITEENPAASLPAPQDHTDYEAYAEAAASVIDSFEGEVAARAGKLVHDLGVDQYYKRLYRNRLWFKRSHAVDTLAALKLKRNREFFSAVFRSETSPQVKYRLIFGLSTLVRGEEDIHAISRMLSALPYVTAKYNEDIFFNIITTLKLAGLEREFGSFLVHIMRDNGVRPLVKRDCISACHAASCDHAAPIVKRYFLEFKDEPEVIIACVKSLVRMGDFDIIHESLFHPDWRVRLTGLKYAHLCKDDLAGELRQLLYDRNYHLRVNAGLALARLGERGLEALRLEIDSKDKFAADAARFALDSARGAA